MIRSKPATKAYREGWANVFGARSAFKRAVDGRIAEIVEDFDPDILKGMKKKAEGWRRDG